MRKIRKLSLFGILVLVTGLLFLIGISFTPAQVQAKGKPDKPPGNGEPEATWAVRIPQSGNMFYGVGDGYYEDNDPNIVVSVKKNKPGTWVRYFNFVYAFDFTITNENVGEGTPPANQVGFRNVGDLDVIDGAPTDQFPGGGIVTFLNGTHPHAGGIEGEKDYQYFWFRIHMFDQDIELMETEEIYLFGDGPDAGEPGDFLSIVARYRQECYQESLYHDVELYRSINWYRAQTAVPQNPQNIKIERLDASTYDIECEAVWRFWVSDTGYYTGLPNGYLKVKERYCTREKNKIKWYYPMEAKGAFNFYIDWIKNPGSSTPPAEPAAPSNLSALAPACNQIDLGWNDNSDNENGFKIERRTDGSSFSQIDTVGANVKTYEDTGLAGETQYWYQVKAYNDAGDSGYSNTDNATTHTCGSTEPPAAPSGLKANARGKSKIALNWTDNSNNEDGFRIYRGLDVNDLDFLVASVGPDITSYVDKGLDSKTTYFYKVCAYKGDGESCSGTVSAAAK